MADRLAAPGSANAVPRCYIQTRECIYINNGGGSGGSGGGPAGGGGTGSGGGGTGSGGGGGTGSGGGTVICPPSPQWYFRNPSPECNPKPRPPAPTQQQLDLQWMESHIKDSTGNRCFSSVIDTLKKLSTTLPSIFRNIFGINGDINIVYKSHNNGAFEGAHTVQNYSTNDFVTTLNTYYYNATTLSTAATILHEMLHAELMNLYRKAVRNNDTVARNFIATEYHLFFDSANIARYPDLNFTEIMSHNQGGQHQIMTMSNIRTQFATVLLQFALKMDPLTTINFDYCLKMAWTGTYDSRGFRELSWRQKDEIQDIVEGERGNFDYPDSTSKGKHCP